MGPAESKLRHCLTARTRRWAVSEFFYSAINRPWFLRNELQVRRRSLRPPEYLRLAAGRGTAGGAGELPGLPGQL